MVVDWEYIRRCEGSLVSIKALTVGVISKSSLLNHTQREDDLVTFGLGKN